MVVNRQLGQVWHTLINKMYLYLAWNDHDLMPMQLEA